MVGDPHHRLVLGGEQVRGAVVPTLVGERLVVGANGRSHGRSDEDELGLALAQPSPHQRVDETIARDLRQRLQQGGYVVGRRHRGDRLPDPHGGLGEGRVAEDSDGSFADGLGGRLPRQERQACAR